VIFFPGLTSFPCSFPAGFSPPHSRHRLHWFSSDFFSVPLIPSLSLITALKYPSIMRRTAQPRRPYLYDPHSLLLPKIPRPVIFLLLFLFPLPVSRFPNSDTFVRCFPTFLHTRCKTTKDGSFFSPTERLPTIFSPPVPER